MVLANALKSTLFMLPSSSTLFQTRYYSSVFNCLATLYLGVPNRGCLSALWIAWLPIQVTAFSRFVAGAWWGIYRANSYVECLQSGTRRAEDDYSLQLFSRRRRRSLRCKAITRQGVTHFTFCKDTFQVLFEHIRTEQRCACGQGCHGQLLKKKSWSFPEIGFPLIFFSPCFHNKITSSRSLSKG